MDVSHFAPYDAVQYHYDKFPPQSIDDILIMNAMIEATDAISRFDQMLKNIHNSEILRSPPAPCIFNLRKNLADHGS